MAGSRTLKLSILADVDDLKKNLDRGSKEVDGFGGKLDDFAKKAGLALAAAATAAGAMAIKIGKEAVQAASDLAETQSKVGVIFADTAKNIETFAAGAAAALGQTRTQAMNAAATFGIFGKSAGLAGQDLTNFSTEFVTLASDLASFNNTSVDQAINALGAALRGESEPIRAYGVMLNDATLKAKAMEMGIYSGTGTLTAQQKVLAAHKVILEQTKDAQGDFARTADGMANSQRILTARLDEAKIVLGQALLPMALNAIQIFNERFLPVIEKMAGAFGGEDGLIAKFNQTGSIIKSILLPIFEAYVAAFNKIRDAVLANRDRFRDLIVVFKDIVDWSNKYLVPLFQFVIVNAVKVMAQNVSTAIKVIVPVVQFVANQIKNLINGVIAGINAVIAAYNAVNNLWGGQNVTPISPIGSMGGSTGGSSSGTSGVINGVTIPSLPTMPSTGGTSTATTTASTPSTSSTPAGTIGSTGSATAAAAPVPEPFIDITGTKSLTSTANELATARLEAQMAAINAANAATNQLAADRYTALQNYYVTVNGAVDPYSTARQIAEILNTEAATSGSLTNIGQNRFYTFAE